MSIIVYTEPNYTGFSTTFDPNTVRIVYLTNKTHEKNYETITEKTFAFVNNDDEYKLADKAESVPFKIGSVKNNNRNFFLLAIGNYLKFGTETNEILKDQVSKTVKPIGVLKYETNLIEGSIEDTLDTTEYNEILVFKYPKCYYNEMIVCIIIIVILITFIVFMKFTTN